MCTCCTVVFWWQFPVEWYHSCTRLLSGIPCGPFRHHWYAQEHTTTYLQRGQKKKSLQANQKSYEKTLELSCQFTEEKFPVEEANRFLSWNKIERYRPKFDYLHPENHTTRSKSCFPQRSCPTLLYVWFKFNQLQIFLSRMGSGTNQLLSVLLPYIKKWLPKVFCTSRLLTQCI